MGIFGSDFECSYTYYVWVIENISDELAVEILPNDKVNISYLGLILRIHHPYSLWRAGRLPRCYPTSPRFVDPFRISATGEQGGSQSWPSQVKRQWMTWSPPSSSARSLQDADGFFPFFSFTLSLSKTFLELKSGRSEMAEKGRWKKTASF